MTTNNWREEFESIYNETASYHNPFPILFDFIETQIAQAEKRGAEEMKKKCLEAIPVDRKDLPGEHTNFTHNYLLEKIRNSISSL